MVYHRTVQHRQVSEPKETKVYYWITAVDEDTGQRIIYGCKPTYEEAQQSAASIHNAITEVVPLKTRDSSKAAQQLRAKVLDETHSIPESFRRFKHQTI